MSDDSSSDSGSSASPYKGEGGEVGFGTTSKPAYYDSGGGQPVILTYEMVLTMINDSETRTTSRLTRVENRIDGKLDGMPGYWTVCGSSCD